MEHNFSMEIQLTPPEHGGYLSQEQSIHMDIQIKILDENNFDDFFSILNQMNLWAEMGGMTDEHKERLHTHYFADPPKFECRLAFVDGKAVGFVSFYNTYATLDARSSLYIEDLFVREEKQSQGVGTALIDECLKLAKERNHGRVDLLSFGEGPRKFYEKLGAKWRSSNFHYRFYEDIVKKGLS